MPTNLDLAARITLRKKRGRPSKEPVERGFIVELENGAAVNIPPGYLIRIFGNVLIAEPLDK